MKRNEESEQPALEERLYAYMNSADYEAQDVSAIARGMGLDSRERPALRALLREWETRGRLLRLRQARYVLRAPAEEPLTGRIRQLKPGKFLFVPNLAGKEKLRPLLPADVGDNIELPVMPHRDAGAMDGDLVRVTLRRTATGYHRRRGKQRPTPENLILEVRVDEILERRRGTWVGVYRPGGRYGTMAGDGRTAPEQVQLTSPPPPELSTGMLVTVEIQSFPRGKMPATGRVVSVLGYPDDAGADIAAIIHRYTLRESFSQAVKDECLALPRVIPEQEISTREDWRTRCVITIDPADARDFDDAISLRRLENGDTELAVHIADVSYYVRPGSALDAEAKLRGNSTYLPDRVLPMLPPLLCDDLCSLRAGEDRLTRLCVLQFTRDGEVRRVRFANSIICSRARLSYEQALAVLEKRGSSGSDEVDAMLYLGHELATSLRQRRLQRGSLDLNIPEIRILTDDNGRPVDVLTESSDDAHRMIEEFMLAANQAVAHALNTTLVPTIYRVHEEPDSSRLQEFALTAKCYGIRAGSLNSRAELTRVVEQIRGHRDEQLLTTALLKAMMRARYATRPLGHFGLAMGDYCHFTSPIRRYADLIVHRGFDKLVHGKHARTHLPAPAALADIAEHISETERNSAAAEHEATQTKLAQFLADECERENPRHWDALVTATFPQGLAVEVQRLQMRGFISGADLADTLGARWFFESHVRRWSSSDGRSILPGDTLHVIPIQVDMDSRFVDFSPVSE